MSSDLTFIDQFGEFLSHHIEQYASHRYLLAVSGGVDSMVMLHLFQQAGLSFEVAHCNFGLRDDASDKDESLVDEISRQYGAKFHSKRFATSTVAKEAGISTQMAARDLRYDWFEELMSEGNFDYLATAHHRGDHAETVLFNLTKGTGIAGLHGIRPDKNRLIRPLMPFTRSEIEQYAGLAKVRWREDASNQSNKYSRNLIRNEVMPLLKQINPSAEKAFWQSSQRIAQVEAWLRDEISLWKKKIVTIDQEITIIRTDEISHHPHHDLILSELIRPFGFSYSDVNDIVDKAKRRAGRQFGSDEYDLVWDRDQVVITPKAIETIEDVTITSEGDFDFLGVQYNVQILNKDDWQLHRSNDILQADADKIVWPITIRTWQEGDSIQPLGMKGRKKVSDILIDEKVPLNLKSRQPVLTDQSDIIWLPGLRMSNGYKVTEATSSVLLITGCP